MTKRQRAKYNQDQDDDDGKFLELPMESNKKKTLTEEEQALKRSEVARRRKHQSVQRAEKDKADTINRLLKKQASKSKRVIKDDGGTNGDNNTMSNKMLLIPGENVRYTTTKNGSQLSLPASLLDDLVHHCMKRPIPRRITCDIHGCENEKKYTAKTSGKAVCSLEHYQLAERT
ncbi:PAPA-1-like conserved region-domain-containing protein [Phascolomyces articulosus]|uniref:PAPA-1-like conserved region-domain-containing protein n=1 Tax=Phascolomyces articulosus TaxID=60185 RepID=A0AAD5JSV0_9FUNG|nr:PAPA-1-like conserved region-domain-containing protein [Phascolomyces articulosus]